MKTKHLYIECRKHFNHVDSKSLCKFCQRRHLTIIPVNTSRLKKQIIDNDKVRNVYSRLTNEGVICCSLSLPLCYSGKKVKVVVVDE